MGTCAPLTDLNSPTWVIWCSGRRGLCVDSPPLDTPDGASSAGSDLGFDSVFEYVSNSGSFPSSDSESEFGFNSGSSASFTRAASAVCYRSVFIARSKHFSQTASALANVHATGPWAPRFSIL